MAFKSLIQNSLDTAFTTLGDLVEDFVFVSSEPDGFDYSTGEVTVGETTSTTIRGIPQGLDATDERLTTLQGYVIEAVFKSSDLSNINLTSYDSMTYDGHSWSLASFTDDGFTTVITLQRNG